MTTFVRLIELAYAFASWLVVIGLVGAIVKQRDERKALEPPVELVATISSWPPPSDSDWDDATTGQLVTALQLLAEPWPPPVSKDDAARIYGTLAQLSTESSRQAPTPWGPPSPGAVVSTSVLLPPPNPGRRSYA